MIEGHRLYWLYYIDTQRRHVFDCGLHITVRTECVGMFMISLSVRAAVVHCSTLSIYTVP